MEIKIPITITPCDEMLEIVTTLMLSTEKQSLSAEAFAHYCMQRMPMEVSEAFMMQHRASIAIIRESVSGVAIPCGPLVIWDSKNKSISVIATDKQANDLIKIHNNHNEDQ